ncbi:conserved Plasmodium protein, unknown function [Plasmodium ovale]|uniref:Protein AMR3 n=1 Tax=Plasmodium ovale TaxID=36330 RepID=A0A1D3U982_PLAOA|nr:conserved Plasmodium protein, unknown function [Plasmodium ovale]
MRFFVVLFKLVFIFLIKITNNYEKLFFVICNTDYISKGVQQRGGNSNIFTFLNIHNKSKDNFKLYMTKKFKYKYKNTLEKRIKKGKIRNEINQKLKKKHSAYIVITEKLSKLDPEQKYFKYDKNILKEYENIKDIYKNKKLKRKFNQYDYWYSSKKKEAKYNYSRHVNFTITENKFNFKNVFSYFHILEIVHEKFKNNSFYINGLQSFINKYYDPVTQKRIKFYDKIREKIEMKKRNGKDTSDQDAEKEKEEKGKEKEQEQEHVREGTNKSNSVLPIQDGIEKENHDTLPVGDNSPQNSNRTMVVEGDNSASRKEFFEMIKKNLSEHEYSNEVNNDWSFKLFGSSTSCLLKKNAPMPYDIRNPFMKTKFSSKRRRYKERKLFDIINFKCKSRRERLMQNAVRKLARRKLKDEQYILDPMDAT